MDRTLQRTENHEAGLWPSRTLCPRCGKPGVRTLTETPLFVHFGCEACRLVWSQPERRQQRRFDPNAPAC